MNMDHSNGLNNAPVAPDNYKRAVYRQPPSRFSVEMLPITKQNGNYSFGMLICPIKRRDRTSVSSRDSHTEYEIWRRWEDCLWFQEIIENEYRRLARLKRQRLVAGKGVKKDGFYQQSMAASFESLPPGPDPQSIAQDVHDYIPKLTKKGTVFRASQATLDQRHAEMKAFVEALFSDRVPALLVELRSDRIVTDFFGYWRRDYHSEQKQQRPTSSKSLSPVSGSSVFSTYFSSSNASNARLESDSRPSTSTSRSLAPSSPRFDAPNMIGERPSTSSGPSSSTLTIVSAPQRPSTASGAPSSMPTLVNPNRRRAMSSTSSDSSTPPSSSRSSGSSMNSNILQITEDGPLVFGHHPDHPDRALSLESLPEVWEPPVKYDSNGRLVAPGRRPRGNSVGDTRGYGNVAVTTHNGTQANNHLPTSRNPAFRESWQTTASAATFLEGLSMSFLGGIPAEVSHQERSRMSVSSIATFMTDSSADAVIPRSNVGGGSVGDSGLRRSLSTGSRHRRRPVSAESAIEDELSDVEGDFVDSYLYDSFPLPAFHLPSSLLHFRESIENAPESPPETPTMGTSSTDPPNNLATQPPNVRRPAVERSMSSPSILSPLPNSFSVVANEAMTRVSNVEDTRPSPPPPDPVTSVPASAVSTLDLQSSHSATGSGRIPIPGSPAPSAAFSLYTISTSPTSTAPVITIKAAHNKDIILVRVGPDTKFSEIRKRIHDKFVGQEDVPLSESFTLAFIPPAGSSRSSVGSGRTRGRSNSLSSIGGMEMKLVLSQGDWDCAIRMMEGNKITLRVLDTLS